MHDFIIDTSIMTGTGSAYVCLLYCIVCNAKNTIKQHNMVCAHVTALAWSGMWYSFQGECQHTQDGQKPDDTRWLEGVRSTPPSWVCISMLTLCTMLNTASCSSAPCVLKDSTSAKQVEVIRSCHPLPKKLLLSSYSLLHRWRTWQTILPDEPR